MLNILFLNDNAEDAFGEPHTQYEFEQTVGKYANCKYAGAGFPDYIADEPMDKTVKRVMPDADWVFDNDVNYHTKKPKKRKYKLGIFIKDLCDKHLYGIKSPAKYANILMENGYDGVFIHYPLIYGVGHLPEAAREVLNERTHWMPWSVNIDRFYPRKEKKYDVAFLNSKGGYYHMRHQIYDGIHYAARGHKILRSTPPVASTSDKYNEAKEPYLTGDDYAEALGSSRILIFDCGPYRYPLLKLFEGGASGCLLMGDVPVLAERLGFIPRVTYTEITAYNWEAGLKFFLNNKKEIKKIAEPGMKMVRMHHSHDVRAVEFLAMLGEVLDE